MEEEMPEGEVLWKCRDVNTNDDSDATESVASERSDLLITSVSDPRTLTTEPVLFNLGLHRIITADYEIEREPQPEYTDADFEEAIRALKATKVQPPAAIISSLRSYLNRGIFAAITEQDYDEAERLKSAETLLTPENDELAVLEEANKQRIESIESRIADGKQKLREVKARWRPRIKEFNAEKQAKTEEMEARHEAEVDALEARWNTRSVTTAFAKPSAQLLHYRRIQRTSALANDFMRAKELKKKADQLERAETRQAEQKATAAMRIAYSNLCERQRKELEFAKCNWDRCRLTMEAERDAEIQKTKLSLRHLETKKGDVKSRPLSCIVKRRQREQTSRCAPSTPRTRRQVVEFKEMTNSAKLAIIGFDVNEMGRVRRQDSVRRPKLSARRPAL